MTATTHTRTFHRYYDTHTHKVPGSQEWCVVGVWQAGTSRNVSASTERKTGAANRATKTSEALRACGCKTGGSRIHSQAKRSTSGGICQNKRDEGLISIPSHFLLSMGCRLFAVWHDTVLIDHTPVLFLFWCNAHKTMTPTIPGQLMPSFLYS